MKRICTNMFLLDFAKLVFSPKVMNSKCTLRKKPFNQVQTKLEINIKYLSENLGLILQQKSKISIEKIVGCACWKTIYIFIQDYVISCSCRKSWSVRDKKELIFHKRSTIYIQLNVWPHSLAHNNNTHTCIHMAFGVPFQAPNTYKPDAFR